MDKYGFAYQKNQYRWLHPRNKTLPIAASDWVAAPATLTEFRRCWDVKGDSPSKQVSCALSFQSGEKIKLSLDTEKDYQAILKMVLEGEEIELTVSQAVPSSTTLRHSTSTQMEYTEHDPPEWFTKYMAKFRDDLMKEISVMIDQKLSRSPVEPLSNAPAAPVVGASRPAQKEMLSFVDFKRLKIDKKLQKLQKRTQKMSLDLEDAPSDYHKSKGERKLSKISRRMEQLEAKKSKIFTRKCSREVAVATETETNEPTFSMPVMIEPQEIVEHMQVSQAPVVESGPKSLFDACVLTEDDSVLHVAVGSAFSKSWTVKNIGEFAWTDKTELRLSHATAGLSAVVDKVLVPILQPGEEGDITVNFQAPAFPGLFETYWHLFNDGDRFGQWLHSSISVDLIPGEHSLECTSMSSSTITQHPAVMEIQKVDMSGSQIQQAEKDREAESDSDDDDDDLSSDSDDSDSFVHIPMPKCYQYTVAPVAAEGSASNSVHAEAGMSASTLLPSGTSLVSNGVVADCKTPPSTPMDQGSDGEAETSDTTQIKYPLLDLTELSQIPPMPALNQAASGEQAAEREQTPVHILPETLVSGAMSVAAKAFSSAEAIMRSIQSPMSSTAAFSIPPVAPQQPAAPVPSSGPPSTLTDVRTQNLITLSEMGFFDAKLNLELLNLYNDNLEHVIADLVIRAKKI